MSYAEWVAYVQSIGGVATVWPFVDDFQGQPAARFDNVTYASAFNAGEIPGAANQQAAPNGQYVYVLGADMGGAAVPAGAPPSQMTMAQSVANAAFTAADNAADAAGLPSLSILEAAAKKYALLAGAGLLALVLVDHYANK